MNFIVNINLKQKKYKKKYIEINQSLSNKMKERYVLY